MEPEIDDISPFDIHVIVCNIFKHIDDYKTFCSFVKVNSVTQLCSRFREMLATADQLGLIFSNLNLELDGFREHNYDNLALQKGDHLVTCSPTSRLIHHGIVVEACFPNLNNSNIIHFPRDSNELENISFQFFGKNECGNDRRYFVISYKNETEDSLLKSVTATEAKLRESNFRNNYAKHGYEYEYFVFLCKMGINRFREETNQIIRNFLTGLRVPLFP